MLLTSVEMPYRFGKRLVARQDVQVVAAVAAIPHVTQGIATGKGFPIDVRHTLRNHDRRERGATHKRTVADFRYTVGHSEIFYVCCVGKCRDRC